MTSTEKIIADARRIIKHDRAEHGGNYDALRACGTIAELFERNYGNLAGLPYSAVQFWIKQYIEPSASIANEPTAEHLEKLGAIASFLEGSSDGTECLTNSDWHKLSDCVKWQADDLDIDILSAMMTVLVEKGALD